MIAAGHASADRGLDWLLGISLYHWMQAQIDVFEVVSEFGRPEDAARFQELLASARDIQRLLHDLQMSDPLPVQRSSSWPLGLPTYVGEELYRVGEAVHLELF